MIISEPMDENKVVIEVLAQSGGFPRVLSQQQQKSKGTKCH